MDFPFDGIQHPASSIEHRASSIQHRASSIEYRPSSIEHPASSIDHRVSSIQHPASDADADADFGSLREAFINRFPSSAQTFHLGDFNLYRLQFEWGRLVSGFARAITLSPDSFKEISAI